MKRVAVPFIYDESISCGYDRNRLPAFPELTLVNIGMSEEGHSKIYPNGK
jgi:hypothetical protein